MVSIICAIISSIICWLIEYIFMPGNFDIWDSIFTFIIVLSIMEWVCYSSIKSNYIKEVEPDIDLDVKSSKEIIALSDNLTVKGHHFLGCGNVNEDLYYYYLEKTESGSKMSRVQANTTYLIEDNSETPRIEEQEVWMAQQFIVVKQPTIWLNLKLFFKCRKYKIGQKIKDAMYLKENRTVIYIPKGSIIKDFKVDLK